VNGMAQNSDEYYSFNLIVGCYFVAGEELL
jgi:hypothetical protein